jgi:hypothetical protein
MRNNIIYIENLIKDVNFFLEHFNNIKNPNDLYKDVAY